MKWVSIQEVAEVNPQVPKNLTEQTNKSVTFLPMAAVSENGTIQMLEEAQLGDVIKGYRYFEKGDSLLAKITPCMENGKAVFVKDIPHEVGFGSTEFHVLRPKSEVLGRYLFYMVWNPAFRHIAGRNMTGTAGQRRVPTDFVKRFQIPLPPIEEQRRIAAILDRADALRRKRKQAIGLTEELLRSAFLEMFGDPVTNPKGWEISPMKKIVVETQYGTAEKSNELMNGLPILRMNNITYSGEIVLNSLKWCEILPEDEKKFTVRRGDLLFNRTNSPELVGKTTVWRSDDRFAFAGYLVRVRFDESKADPEYVSAFLNSSYGKKYLLEKAKPSINMSNFSASEFLKIPIPLPDIKEQYRFREFASSTRRISQKLGNSLRDYENLFNSLLQRAFRGEL